MAKYIDADLLKAEIEKRKELLENGTGHPEVMKRVEGVIKAYNSILAFIDTHQEQPVEGLEEAAKKYLDGVFGKGKHQDFYVHLFIAGAEWQKDKILRLIETRISEIIGDAQPNPVLRIELQGIIDKIK